MTLADRADQRDRGVGPRVHLPGPSPGPAGRRDGGDREHARDPARQVEGRRHDRARLRPGPSVHRGARQRAQPGLDQPGRQRHPRDGRDGPISTIAARPAAGGGRRRRGDPGQRAGESRRRSRPTSSTRSSRPRAWEPEPASASTSRGRSWSATAAASRWRRPGPVARRSARRSPPACRPRCRPPSRPRCRPPSRPRCRPPARGTADEVGRRGAARGAGRRALTRRAATASIGTWTDPSAPRPHPRP